MSSSGVPARSFALVVRDSGPGIDPDKLEAAFEPFSRLHEEANGRVFGAGLGLYITRGLVEAHSGRISLDSRPGQGTTVRILLPCDPATARLLRAERTLAAWAETARATGAGRERVAAVLDFRAVPETAACRTGVVERYLEGTGAEEGAAPRVEIAPGLWAGWLPRRWAEKDHWPVYLAAQGESECWLRTSWEAAPPISE